MNTVRTQLRTASSSVAARSYAPTPVRSNQAYGNREFGVGYGSSSGYASPTRYVPNNTPRLFRFV
ncbi:MAG: hypothetical protein R3278_02320 [Lysobacter spongiicola]|nr:hypothetical protein [Lysobacter spongiicola]